MSWKGVYVFGAGFPGVPAGEGEADCVLCLMVDVMARGHEVSIFGALPPTRTDGRRWTRKSHNRSSGERS